MSTENENVEKPVLYPDGGEVTFLMPNTNMIGKLKEAKKGQNLTASYMTVADWEKVINVPKRCIFLGFKEAKDPQGNTYYLARLIDENQNPFVSAPTILTQSLAMVPAGQGVEITCTKVEKNSSNGRTPFFTVVMLDFNVFGAPKEEEAETEAEKTKKK